MRLLKLIALLATVTATAAGAARADSPTRPSGTLQLQVAITQEWSMSRDACPPETPPAGTCVHSVGEGPVRGLGRVRVTYRKVIPGDDPSCFIVHQNTVTFEVAGKGTLHLSRAGRDCAGPPPRDDGPLEFTVAGGSGAYAGASGTLVYRSSVTTRQGPCCTGSARDTWTGALTVPGLDFDTTPPKLHGAVSKTVRAPRRVTRVRVRYSVKASDAVDGAVPVSCKPRSGSFFAVGRTTVLCSATDSSANTAQRRFTITVRRTRR